MRTKKLCGVNPPIPTIFNKDGKLDMEANYKVVDFLIEKGVNGISLLGTNGEFSLLTMDEKKYFIKEMTSYINKRVNVIVGAGDTCIYNVEDIIRTAEESEADGILLVNPYYTVYGEEMVEAFYDTIAPKTSLPIILYNIPSMSGFTFSPELVMRLIKKHDNIAGIKETINDSEHVRAMLRVKDLDENFCVYGAFENHAACIYPLGIDGYINSTATFAPEFTVGAYNAWNENNMKDFVYFSKKMSEAMDVYYCSSPLLLPCKEAVYQRILGYSSFSERLPGLSLNESQKQQVSEILKKMSLI